MKIKKVLGAALAAAVLGASVLAFAGCGTSAATLTGSYVSENDITYQNFLPTYNYYYATITNQQLDTYDDDTYVLTVTTTSFSNISLGADVAEGEETWNDRGHSVTRYYGDCVITEDSSDDSVLYITISEPSRVVFTMNTDISSSAAAYYDTDNWTDDMTEASGSDAASYLATYTDGFSSSGIEIVAYLTTYSFEQVSW